MLRGGAFATVWTFNSRFIAIDDDDIRYRYTLDYRALPELSVGLEYTPGREELLPRFTWLAHRETDHLPSVVVGMASDRLSTPRGQAYFLTFAKGFGQWSPFASLKFSSDDGMIAFPFGVNVRIGPTATAQFQNDGNYTHALLTFNRDNFNVSLILARMRHPGIAISFGF